MSMNQMSMTDAGMTQDNFILSAPPVGGLPTSQDRLDRMKLVRDNLGKWKEYIGEYVCMSNLLWICLVSRLA